MKILLRLALLLGLSALLAACESEERVRTTTTTESTTVHTPAVGATTETRTYRY